MPSLFFNQIFKNEIEELELKAKSKKYLAIISAGWILKKNYLLTFSSQSLFYENHLLYPSPSDYLCRCLSKMCLLRFLFI